ncbi:hypothetical protein [Thiohalocapsa marina]|uniref:hypothetical protein n=1 Tax=Thiohalocapsa marina TaxID=424902 RepID=UPI0036DEA54C
MNNYSLNDYADALGQCLRPEWRPLVDAPTLELLAKAAPPGQARGMVPQARLAAERQKLANMVGQLPSTEIAQREAEINALEDQMRSRGWLS